MRLDGLPKNYSSLGHQHSNNALPGSLRYGMHIQYARPTRHSSVVWNLIPSHRGSDAVRIVSYVLLRDLFRSDPRARDDSFLWTRIWNMNTAGDSANHPKSRVVSCRVVVFHGMESMLLAHCVILCSLGFERIGKIPRGY